MGTMALPVSLCSTILISLRTLLTERKFDPVKSSQLIEADIYMGSLHTGTVAGKLLTEQFYKKKYSYSYYLGCSLGGRMGIKAAELYPDDFDGIVAGCPAVDFNHLQGWRASFYPITGAVGSENFINATLWTGLIHNEVLKQCDSIDGVTDGIIEIPAKCFFKPETLLCSQSDTIGWAAGKCLNADQVQQIKTAYEPYTYPNGELIFPRMNPGNEINTATKFFAGAPFSYSEVSNYHNSREKLPANFIYRTGLGMLFTVIRSGTLRHTISRMSHGHSHSTRSISRRILKLFPPSNAKAER